MTTETVSQAPDVRARQWADALRQFNAAEVDRKIAPATITRRGHHLNRFAESIALGPWEVTFPDIAAWLEGQVDSGNSAQTARIYRSSIRSFYRWAYLAKRIFEDPSLEPSRRPVTLESPPLWDLHIRQYRSFLRGVGRTEETVRTRVNCIRRFARDHPSTDPWTLALDEMVEWMAGKRWASETRKMYRDALRNFYGWAVDTGRTDRNPAAKIPPIRARGPEARPAPDAAYAEALAKASPRERLALRLAAEIGLRRGEVVLVHSRDLFGENGLWSLRVHGKGGKERSIPLPFSLGAALHSLEPGYAFPGGVNGHLSPWWMGTIISRLLPAGVTMHALRHRFATRAYAVDRDVFTVQQLLGHASPATTQRYVHIADTDRRRTVEAIA